MRGLPEERRDTYLCASVRLEDTHEHTVRPVCCVHLDSSNGAFSTEAKPHKCRVCPQEFGDPSSRSRHHFEIHGLGERKAIVCPIAECWSRYAVFLCFRGHSQILMTAVHCSEASPRSSNGNRTLRTICGRSTRSIGALRILTSSLNRGSHALAHAARIRQAFVAL
jgi:hypothetical protein